MTNYKPILVKALQENHLEPGDTQITQLCHYLTLLQTWNQVFNLTTITDPKDMVYLHLIDSLMIAPYLLGKRLLDVGSGGGLPGIPLAILDPTRQWVLLDKVGKKTRFLTQVVAELQLTNVQVQHSNSHDFHPEHCFDSILSRAFGTIRHFIEATQHLLCQNGKLIAMKGKYPQEELTDVPSSFKVTSTTRLTIQGIHADRHIVCLQCSSPSEK